MAGVFCTILTKMPIKVTVRRIAQSLPHINRAYVIQKGPLVSTNNSRMPIPVYFFIHIPKTGGQSIRDHLIEQFGNDPAFVNLGPDGIRDDQEKGRLPFHKRPASERSKARVVFGHNVDRFTPELVPNCEVRFVTFLREPAAQIVSNYNFQMESNRREGKTIPDFESWYSPRPRNPHISWMFGHFLHVPWTPQLSRHDVVETVAATLRCFYLVGRTEKLSDDVKPIFEDLGFPTEFPRRNQTGKDFAQQLVPTDELMNRLRAENDLDYALLRRVFQNDSVISSPRASSLPRRLQPA